MLNHSAPEKSSILSKVNVAGSIADGASLARLGGMKLEALCDIVELRVDTWPDRADEGLARAGECPVPVLVTVRRPDEGGRHDLDAATRAALARRFLPVADLIDIEIASLGELADLVAEAKAGGVPVVASFHDFSGTPPVEVLQDRRDLAIAAGADAVKFATVLKSSADLAVLASLLEEPDHPPMSVMGMGPLGRVSRLLLARLGSVLNYGYLDEATVPGQWPAARLRELIREL